VGLLVGADDVWEVDGALVGIDDVRDVLGALVGAEVSDEIFTREHMRIT
jgi:hypothetical protein